MPVFLRLQRLWRPPEAEGWRLLRVLLLRFDPVPADSGRRSALRLTQYIEADLLGRIRELATQDITIPACHPMLEALPIAPRRLQN
jgi:hypothetical protein